MIETALKEEFNPKLREIIRETFKGIPLPEQENMLNDIHQSVKQFGLFRSLSIGEVLKQFCCKGIGEIAKPAVERYLEK